MAVGGFQPRTSKAYTPLNSTEFYDSVQDAWSSGPQMPTPRSGVQVANVATATGINTLYIVGGNNATADDCYKTLSILEHPVLALDLNSSCASRPGVTSCLQLAATRKGWTEVSQIPTRRSYISVKAIGKTVYAIGGYNGTHDTDVVETFDVDTKLWRKCTNM